MPDFYFILFLMRLDADEKLQYFQLPYIPCRMVSGNEIKLCLKCRFTFNKSGYIFPYVDSVYYTQLSRE
jgi:hypothetical protein